MIGYSFRSRADKSATQKRLRKHFGGLPLDEIVTSARTFPLASKVDAQGALDAYFDAREKTALLGIHAAMKHETPTMAHLLIRGPWPVEIGPLQHDEVDIGDPTPARCLKNGLWLSVEGRLPFAVLLGPAMKFGNVGG